MAEVSTPTLGTFPSSPYAAELSRGPDSRSFAPLLEAEFARLHLGQMRTLIRVTCVVGAAAGGGARHGADTGGGVESITARPIRASCLRRPRCWLPWRGAPWFMRLYLPVRASARTVAQHTRRSHRGGRCGGGAGRSAHAAAVARHRAVFRARATLPRRACRGSAHGGRRTQSPAAVFGLALPLIARSCVVVAASSRPPAASWRGRYEENLRVRASSKAI